MTDKRFIISFCIIVILYFGKDLYLNKEEILKIEPMSTKETVFSEKELTNG